MSKKNKMRIGYYISFLFLSLTTFGQRNFQPGWVITNQSDTVRGFLDQREWLRNPKLIKFKSQQEAITTRTLTPDSIQGFGVSEYAYQSLRINVKSEGDHLFFLRVLSRGNALTFYEYRNKSGSTLYYAENEGDAVELFYAEQIEDGHVTRNEKYKGQLNQLGKKYLKEAPTDFEAKINTLHYNRSGIESFAEFFNGPVSRKVEKGAKHVSFSIGAGAALGNVKYVGSTALANSVVSTSPSFVLSTGLDFYFNPVMRRTFVRLAADFTQQKFNIRGNYADAFYSYSGTQDISQAIFAISASFNYNIYYSKDFNFFVGMGIRDNICSYPENSYQETYTSLRSQVSTTYSHYGFPEWKASWLAIPISVGILYKNKIELSYTRVSPTAVTSDGKFKATEYMSLVCLKLHLTKGKQ